MAAFLYPCRYHASDAPHEHAPTCQVNTQNNDNRAIMARSGGHFLCFNPFGAQCFPRHACPLYEVVLMQLHYVGNALPLMDCLV